VIRKANFDRESHPNSVAWQQANHIHIRLIYVPYSCARVDYFRPVEIRVQKRLCGRFHDIQATVAELIAGTVGAGSLVENLNSRLRGYFFLRRHLGPDYLALLQFFLKPPTVRAE
jgi:hypothetical protein